MPTERQDEMAESAATHRASISFPPQLYRELEHIAKRKKVSVAWVVRDAVEKYVANQPIQREQE